MKELRFEDVTGTVTTYKENEGYGFLSTLDVKDGGTTDVFFHISDIQSDSVAEGWRYKFDVFSSRNGFHAENLELLSKDSKKETETSVEERFLRNQNREYDQTKYNPRSLKKDDENDEEEDEEEEGGNKSPFEDDLTGSKNDLL